MTMDIHSWAVMAFAPPTAQGTSTVPPWMQMVPFVLLFVVMYLVMIVPGQKKEKQRQEMLKALKVGDKIVTSSGIVGVVVSLRDTSITVRSDESKLEVLKNGIQEVLERKA
jgi:preprotein translocase subunit YajC